MADLFSLLMARATGQATLLRARRRGIFEDGTAPLSTPATISDDPSVLDTPWQASDHAEPAAREPARAVPAPDPPPGLPATLAVAQPRPTRLGLGRATTPVLARRLLPMGEVPAAAVQALRAPATTPPAPSPILAPIQAPIHSLPVSPTASPLGVPAAPLTLSAVATANEAPDRQEAPRAMPSRTVRPMQPAAPLAPVSRRDGVAKAAPPPPPDIRIEIGRIEVRTPAPPAAPKPRASGLMPLDRYLRRGPPR